MLKEPRPILISIPESFESERLTIRVTRTGDGESLHEAIVESIDALRQWLPWAKKLPTIQDSEEHARSAYAEFLLRKKMQLLYFEKTSGQLVGSSGFHNILWEIPSLEIGYWCRTTQIGKGYTTEAVRRISQFAFEVLGAKRVAIQCDSKNHASNKVPQKLGFKLAGVLRNDSITTQGAIANTCIYSMVALRELI